MTPPPFAFSLCSFYYFFSHFVSLSLSIFFLSGAEKLPQAVGYRKNKKERKRKKEMGVV